MPTRLRERILRADHRREFHADAEYILRTPGSIPLTVFIGSKLAGKIRPTSAAREGVSGRGTGFVRNTSISAMDGNGGRMNPNRAAADCERTLSILRLLPFTEFVSRPFLWRDRSLHIARLEESRKKGTPCPPPALLLPARSALQFPPAGIHRPS